MRFNSIRRVNTYTHVILYSCTVNGIEFVVTVNGVNQTILKKIF